MKNKKMEKNLVDNVQDLGVLGIADSDRMTQIEKIIKEHVHQTGQIIGIIENITRSIQIISLIVALIFFYVFLLNPLRQIVSLVFHGFTSLPEGYQIAIFAALIGFPLTIVSNTIVNVVLERIRKDLTSY